ncbi:GntR family transcriptional regulator [Streptomyces sp. URMC 123]|uniref:GntR family transcriptional regulator n=1 Tax=Streptomyces sp. URMC 123 TaxID=3423403 RepID=UPI003F1BC859
MTPAHLRRRIADKPRRRWQEHAQDKQWWPQVTLRTEEWFETRVEAEAAERAAIGAERPRYNGTDFAGAWAPAKSVNVELIIAYLSNAVHGLEQDLAAGAFPATRFLPSAPELAQRYGVAVPAVKQALQISVERGVVVRFPGNRHVPAGPAVGRSVMAQDLLLQEVMGLFGDRPITRRQLREATGRSAFLIDSYVLDLVHAGRLKEVEPPLGSATRRRGQHYRVTG